MTLSSMTGFARADGHAAGLSWHWEIKSVNGKSLDIRLRLPAGLEALEIEARALAQSRFHRGSLQVSLDVRRESLSDIRINEAALNRLVKLAKSVQKKHKLRPPSVEGLLALPGVLEPSEEPASEQEKANTAAGSPAAAVEAPPPPYVPRRLLEVAGKRVPIPLKRPKKG